MAYPVLCYEPVQLCLPTTQPSARQQGSAYTQLPRRHGFGVGILTAGVRGLRAKPLQDTGEVCLTQENNACCGPMSNLQVCLPLHVERLEPRHIGRT
jgi:hypothetical protein